MNKDVKKVIKEEIQKQNEKEEGFRDRLDAIQYATQIQSPMGTEITSDATLSVLNQKDKEGISNMRENMEQAKIILELIYDTHMTRTNNIEDEKLKQHLNKQKERITRLYMIQPYMIMNLNRNLKDNPMLEILGGKTDLPEQAIQQEPEESTFFNKLKKRLEREDGK